MSRIVTASGLITVCRPFQWRDSKGKKFVSVFKFFLLHLLSISSTVFVVILYLHGAYSHYILYSFGRLQSMGSQRVGYD